MIEGREGERKGGRGTQKGEEGEGERLVCKPWEGGVSEGGGRSRRRGGRVSNTIKTLEEGAKQINKIYSYFSNLNNKCKEGRERGHSFARAENLCGGVKRRMDDSKYNYHESENDGMLGSAKKRARYED